MKKGFTALMVVLLAAFLIGCTPVDLDAAIPVYETGVDPQSWALVPAGEFLAGQFNDPVVLDYDYEIMITDVTVAQYVAYLNEAVQAGALSVEVEQVVGYYPGDVFHEGKHELEIKAGDYIIIPLADPASRFIYDGKVFTAVPGYENHPMTNVSWFGARAYCNYYNYRLPLELEWEKAARGSEDSRPFPWGEEIGSGYANFYSSRDLFEDMSSFGSRTSPVGFYNGQTYDGFQTYKSTSPYGLYDMAGNVCQWTADITEGLHDRFLRGGSKDTYKMDLRIWVRNSAPPFYFSPGVGFRCVRDPQN